MANCKCGQGMVNMSANSCATTLGVSEKLIAVPLYDNTGAKNKILASDFVNDKLPSAFITGKLNQPDKSKRWFPISSKLREVTDVQDEDAVQTIDGVDYTIASGFFKFTGTMPKEEATTVGFINSNGCTEMGFYVISDSGNLEGIKFDESGDLYPMPIVQGTLKARLTKPTFSTIQSVALSFSWGKSVKVEDIRVVYADNIEVDLLNAKGLYNTYGLPTGTQSVTDISFFLKRPSSKYGDLNRVGAVLSDLVFTQNSVVVTPTAISENMNGSYTVDATFVAGDVVVSQATLGLTGDELTPFTITIS